MVLKAQAFMLDAVMSSILMMFLILVVFSFAYARIDSLKSELNDFKQQEKLFFASQALVMTSGIPRNWTAIDVKAVGLAKYENNTVMHHELSLDKIGRMLELGEEKTYELLKLPQNSCITIRTRSKSIGFDCVHKGVKVIRFALCGGEECVVELS